MPARSAPYLANRLAALPPSGTLAVGERVRALRAAGRTLRRIDAHLNDPEFGLALADRLHQMIQDRS